MCQAKDEGGIRCASHARTALAAAQKTGDNRKITIAEDDYFVCSAGLKELKDSNDPRYDAYKAMRETRVAIAKTAASDAQAALARQSANLLNEANRNEHAYATAENNIVNLFEPGATFSYKGREFTSVVSDKPRVGTGGGEGKTDIYVKAVDADGNEEEIKISYKKENADSYENWVSAARAEATFGENWKSVVTEAIEKNQEKFLSAKKYDRRLRSSKSASKGGAYTLGYAFDIRSNSRNLSVQLDNLTHEQEKEIYSGATLPESKKNCVVNGSVVEDSGVATHMLVSDTAKTPQEAIDSLVSMDDYVSSHRGQLHMAFKAVNYYYYENKGEASRPLAVTVNWEKNKHGRMVNTLDTSNPLSVSSTEALAKIRSLTNRNIVRTKK